ncbi:zinc finger BED domain-containing protein 4-like [Leptinotarsa decemlineata]|uniref:zinc finger BED domain-containing protein 4-like n=1 Tax=Leptinotarsa decemlineata TaxID=7539 RepID=UPI003D30C40D
MYLVTETHQGCFVHTLQLTIKDSIDCQRAVIDVIAKARRIVTHFNHSATACDKLKKLQEQMNVPTKKLIQDIQTRWNSSYYMLERLLEQKKVISIYILDNPDLTDQTFHQWDLVQKLINLLQPFEEITKLSSNRECCISEVIPLVKTLDSYLSNRSKSAIYSGVDTLRSDLQKNLEKRFNHIFTEESFTLATLLDPRFKNSFFDNEGGPIYEILKRKITVQEGGSGIIKTITDGESDGEDNMPLVKLLAMERDSGASKSVHDLFWESYEHFAGEGTSGSSKRKQRSAFVEVLDDEIKLYQSHPIISRNKNPVQWWNDNKLRFPNLFPQAAIYLSAPAGSVPSEQVFSEAGNIYDAKCSRLTSDRAESLLFLHHNLPKLNYQY